MNLSRHGEIKTQNLSKITLALFVLTLSACENHEQYQGDTRASDHADQFTNSFADIPPMGSATYVAPDGTEITVRF